MAYVYMLTNDKVNVLYFDWKSGPTQDSHALEDDSNLYFERENRKVCRIRFYQGGYVLVTAPENPKLSD